MLDVINQVAHPPNELGIFTRMENDVLRRTKKANATIQKWAQYNFKQNNYFIIKFDLCRALENFLYNSPEKSFEFRKKNLFSAIFSANLNGIFALQRSSHRPFTPHLTVKILTFLYYSARRRRDHQNEYNLYLCSCSTHTLTQIDTIFHSIIGKKFAIYHEKLFALRSFWRRRKA